MSDLGDRPGGAMGHDMNPIRICDARTHDEIASGLGEHHDRRRGTTEFSLDVMLGGSRSAEHGVKAHDVRNRQLGREGQDILAVSPAKNPELVLDDDDVASESTEQPSTAAIVRAHIGRHGGHHGGWIDVGLAIGDGDDIDSIHTRCFEKRRSQIGRERGQSTRAWWVCRQDCSTHTSVDIGR